MSELLPCPFFGRPAKMHFNGYGNNEHIARCSSALSCGARGSAFPTKEEASEKWNKRTSEKNWRKHGN